MSTDRFFFADADRFRERLHELVLEEEAPTCVVVDAEAVHLTDTDGADMLIQVEEELRAQGVALALARVIHRSSPSGNVPGRST